MCNHHKKPIGSTLADKKQHQADHNKWNRRSFIKNIGLAGASGLILGQTPVTALMASPIPLAASTGNDNIIVLIQLNGGNDGLNTIVPVYDYSTYINNRPTIGIPENQLINLNDSFAMPNTMEALHPMWQEGKMKVVHSVGYPDQNLSHFRGSDIWSSASNADEFISTGWMGRQLFNEYPDFLNNPPDCPPAIHIGGFSSVTFAAPDNLQMAVSVGRPEDLANIAENGTLYDVQNLPDDCYYGEQVGYLRTIANNTFHYAEAISTAYSNADNAVQYQGNLGTQLAMVARLIKGNLGTRIYMVTLGGFDTHAGQNQSHPQLMSQLANSVSAFYDDLATDNNNPNIDQKVLCMTWSEFGRRPEQNASNGTDHGAAAPMLLFGAGLNGNGFIGTPPDLVNLDNNGNIVHGTDFRQVYASVLENWLCVAPNLVDDVLGQSFNRLELGISCEGTTSVQHVSSLTLKHWAHKRTDGNTEIHYILPQQAKVKVEIFTINGQKIAQLFDGQQNMGEQSVIFEEKSHWLSNANYLYALFVNGKRFGGKF